MAALLASSNISARAGGMHGRERGYAAGRTEGFFRGQSERIVRLTPPREHPIRNLHVLYVTAGIGVPYPALDQSIIDGLEGLVAKVTPISPGDDAAKLADRIKPDLVLALNGVNFPPEQIKAIRHKGIPTAVWLTDDPYYTDWTVSIAPRYDFVFTLERSCVPLYKELGCQQVFYLPFAASPKLYVPQHIDASYRSDICFIGSAFWNRVALIDSLADFLVDKKVFIAGWWWDRLKHYHKLSDSIRLGEWLSPEETAKYYHGAKLVINLHREAEDHTINFNERNKPAYSVNPRTFEIAASGTFQLADPRQDLNRFYAPGKEIVIYHSPEQLKELINYYLQNNKERNTIALNALYRTRNEHTYRERLAEMLEWVFD